MTSTINSVITAININRPGLSPQKRNLLLFFCQGHYLARDRGAMFTEPLYAAGGNIAIDPLNDLETTPPSNGVLNTINAVLMRYADLSPTDLRTLIHATTPWKTVGESGRINHDALRVWFQRDDETNDPNDGRPTRDEMAEAEAWLRSRPAARLGSA